MSVPDIDSIYCSQCSVYNISSDCCICKDCMERIINEELMKVIKVLGISMAGKYRCQGAVELSKALKQRFAKVEQKGTDGGNDGIK